MKWKRKRKGPVMPPTASMGDIAFLLIIFFMVCSNFAKEQNIRYKPAEAKDVEAVQDTGLSVVMDDEGRLYLNGRALEGTTALKTELEAMLKSRSDPTKHDVLFKCDERVSRRVFEPAINAIISAGGVVLAVGDKRRKD